MKLEDVLEQKSEIEQFLSTLCDAHHRLLFNVQDAEKLDKVRNDVKICFNDLCKLNGILISVDGDGSIRREIDRLKKQGSKLTRLNAKHKELISRKEQWQLIKDASSERKPSPMSSDTFSLKGNYHDSLNEYIDDVGILQTSLTDGNTQDEVRESPVKDFEALSRRLALLNFCRKEVNSEIKQLESLLSNFRKDEEFINREWKRQRSEVGNIILQFDEDLRSVRRSQEKILVKLGLHENSETKNSSILFNLTKKPVNDEETLDEELKYADELIKAKVNTLNDELASSKEQMHQMEHTRNLWDEAISKIAKLEEELKDKLLTNPNIYPKELSQPIEDVIKQLEDLYSASSSSSEFLRKCLYNEIEVLQKAKQELDGESGQQVKRQVQPRKNLELERSPSFLTTGTSPPKIGITRETIPSLNGSFSQAGRSTLSLEKIQKNE